MNEAFININGGELQSLELFLMITVLSLLPSIIIMMTSFTRIIIVMSFLRNALGLQQTPPNTVLVGISLFLTLFIMSPVLTEINENAYIPYKNEQISAQEALDRASVPMKTFMLKQTEVDTLDMFMEFSGEELRENYEELPLTVVIPSFITSELKRAFIIGFLLFLPFLLIDIVVSSTLMSMGMIMLPPAMISLPFKILLFITVNGWQLLFSTLIKGFN
ncbi:flagellar type III secretion system pore protein FliP [Anaerotignum sp. MB30-C6]|uniref:flagellar type III secretion system pore protein FliP n=1 Tax=Anaerotignum sp. MB30-C6 TaxID=3070814 RepID=UPI0027DD5810|nr:flagellar type III secretion system pore protein FliP [Anaerotignum sp. MB30-C6]WMI80973.1 flagellar type III secretion system pore protein FliP [Anaerotignum sp. MB30-C6]